MIFNDKMNLMKIIKNHKNCKNNKTIVNWMFNIVVSILIKLWIHIILLILRSYYDVIFGDNKFAQIIFNDKMCLMKNITNHDNCKLNIYLIIC